MPVGAGDPAKAEQNGTQPPLFHGAHWVGWFFLAFRGLAAPATDPDRLGSDRRLGAVLGCGSGDLVLLRAGQRTADAISIVRGPGLSWRRAPGGRRRAVLSVGALSRDVLAEDYPGRASHGRLALHHQLGHRPGH